MTILFIKSKVVFILSKTNNKIRLFIDQNSKYVSNKNLNNLWSKNG